MTLSRPELRLLPPPGDRDPQRKAIAAGDDADDRLLGNVRAGDRRAAAAFHDRVRPQVDRTVRRLLGARDPDLEDVTQQVLIELVTSCRRFRGDCPLDAWVSRVAAHTVYKHIRRRRTERGIFMHLLVEPQGPAGGLSDPDWRSVIERVVGILSAMNPAKSWAYVLHDVLGFELTEIAAMQGITPSAAQTRLSRGRRELHKRIAADLDLANSLDELRGAS